MYTHNYKVYRSAPGSDNGDCAIAYGMNSGECDHIFTWKSRPAGKRRWHAGELADRVPDRPTWPHQNPPVNVTQGHILLCSSGLHKSKWIGHPLFSFLPWCTLNVLI